MALAGGAAGARAQEGGGPAEKSQYHLFHPTPAAQMREMTTDRPDQTESPYTVDAGHFQLELDLFNYTHDREGGISSETWAVAPFNLKVGLLNHVDVQFALDTHMRQRVTDRAAGTVERQAGVGDLQTRLKVNLWGNDGGTTALGLMPFVKWPTARRGLGNGAVEGGLIVPLAIGLGKRAGLGLMTEVDFLRNDADDGYRADYVNSITLGVDLTSKLGVYTEFFTVVSTERDADWRGQFDVGFTYALSERLQLDTGVNLGVTRNAPDWQPFMGLSWRF